MRLALDFAAKFTAGIVMDRAGDVKYQFDSFGKSTFEFCEEVADIAAQYEVDLVIVEDVPFGISRQSMIKPVLRSQGILMKELGDVDKLDVTRFLSPAEWQCHFEGVWKGGPEGARAAAERLGYTAPVLLEAYEDLIPAKGPERAKVRAQLRKASTDYDDAFLIGRWSLDVGDDAVIHLTQPPII